MKKLATPVKTSTQTLSLTLSSCLLLSGLLLTSGSAFAGTTAQEGLEKLKNNLAASKTNFEEYQRNFKLVEANVAEVTKSKAQVDKDRSMLAKTMLETTIKLKSFERTEAELNLLLATEKKEMAVDRAKAVDLSTPAGMAAQENVIQRTANVASYEDQLKQLSIDKIEWSGRTESLSKSMKDLEARTKTLVQQESEWKQKLQTYKTELAKWQKESDRQQKLSDNYRSLADIKD